MVNPVLNFVIVKLPAYKAGHLMGGSIEGGWLPPSPPQIGLPFIPVHRTGHPGISSECPARGLGDAASQVIPTR